MIMFLPLATFGCGAEENLTADRQENKADQIMQDEACGVDWLGNSLPAGLIEGTLAFATCPKNLGATEPFSCAVVIVSDDGLERTGLLLKTGEIDPVDVEPQLECLLGSHVAVRTTGVLESYEGDELKGLVSSSIDKELRWGGQIFHRL